MPDPTFISDTALTRRLARNVTTNDFSNGQVVLEQEAAYSLLIIKTGKSDWNSTDNRFKAVQKAEEQTAARYILEHYGAGTAEELAWITYWKDNVFGEDGIITTLIEEGVDAEADINVLDATSNYESYPASLQDNQFAQPYRSTTTHI